MQRAAEEVGKAAFDAICSAQKGSSTRRLEPYLSLPYLTLPSEGADADPLPIFRCPDGATALSGFSPDHLITYTIYVTVLRH